MTGLAPGYRRQRFTVSISYPDSYEPLTTDDVALVLNWGLDGHISADMVVMVTTDAAEDEHGEIDGRPGWSLRDAELAEPRE